MIKAVIFDYGGVIDTGTTWQDIVQKAPGLSKYSGFKAMFRSTLNQWLIAEVGGETAPFWQAVADTTGQTPKQIRQYFIEATQPVPAMLDLVAETRKKYKVALLSDNVKDWLEPIIAANDLHSKFDIIVTSYEQKIGKPDPKVFNVVLQQLDVKPEHTVFIDDNPKNVAAARQLGMTGLDFENIEKLKQDLIRLEML